MGAPTLSRRGLVEAILRAEGISPLLPGEQRSGVAVAPNGASIALCLSVADGGAARQHVYDAWFALAVEVLRAGGISVTVPRGRAVATLEAGDDRKVA